MIERDTGRAGGRHRRTAGGPISRKDLLRAHARQKSQDNQRQAIVGPARPQSA